MNYAILIDGGFIRQIFKTKRQNHITADQVMTFCNLIKQDPLLNNNELFRVYFYDSPPYKKELKHPLTGNVIPCPGISKMENFQEELEMKPTVAFRRGELTFSGWTVTNIKNMVKRASKGSNIDNFIVPKLNQKTVDMKIGLDIAWMASKKIVDKMVLVTGDSDFVPAMKFARREGVIVYLTHLNNPVRNCLIAHSDGIIDIDLNKI